MKFGNFEKPSNPSEKENHKETPARFRLAVEAILKANFKNIEVSGEENLKKIPLGAKVIIATTHISDYDVVIPIAKLGKQFRMKVVNASVQHSFSQDPGSYLGMQVIGKENTIPVNIHFEKNESAGKSYYASPFNIKNFEPMKNALDEGDTIVMAAYTPPPIKDGKLGKKGGYGVVYLSEISDAYILPVAINIKSENPEIGTRKSPLSGFLNRPEAQMIIGEPIVPKKEDISNEKNNLDVREIREKLQDKSNELMFSLANLLPAEKRGLWDKE